MQHLVYVSLRAAMRHVGWKSTLIQLATPEDGHYNVRNM
jgi:hypothetical protein